MVRICRLNKIPKRNSKKYADTVEMKLYLLLINVIIIIHIILFKLYFHFISIHVYQFFTLKSHSNFSLYLIYVILYFYIDIGLITIDSLHLILKIAKDLLV